MSNSPKIDLDIAIEHGLNEEEFNLIEQMGGAFLAGSAKKNCLFIYHTILKIFLQMRLKT